MNLRYLFIPLLYTLSFKCFAQNKFYHTQGKEIIDPNGNVLLNGNGIQPGATLAGPERATVDNPVSGNWRVVVDGFNIPAGSDKFQLRVMVDGHILSH